MPSTSKHSQAPTTNQISAPRRDEVDRIVTAWAKQRPDLNPDPMRVFSRITRLARHLDRERRQAFAGHNLEPWEFDVLSSLRRMGKPHAMSPGRLMEELLVSSGTMTNRIDRLEEKGLVKRTPSPTDRRAILVTATPAGIAAVDLAIASLLEREEQLLNCLRTAQCADLDEILRELSLLFEADNT